MARYGKECDEIKQSWRILSNSIYNAPVASTQQGTHESVFCARPSLNVYQVSSWSEMSDYYDPEEVIKAARLMLSVADQFKGNNNFEYDLVDVVRQAIAEKGRLVLKAIKASGQAGENAAYQQLTKRFLDLILLQDELLSTRPEFKVGTWIEMARKKGFTQEEKDLYEWNARVQITTWGIVQLPNKEVCVIMRIVNGVVCCVMSIMNDGKLSLIAEWILRLTITPWMRLGQSRQIPIAYLRQMNAWKL